MQHAYSRPSFSAGDFGRVGRNDLVFYVQSGFIIVGLCAQDFTFLCAAVTICVTLVDIQAHADII